MKDIEKKIEILEAKSSWYLEKAKEHLHKCEFDLYEFYFHTHCGIKNCLQVLKAENIEVDYKLFVENE